MERRGGKRALQKALKDRLERLTLSLSEAEVGNKGIELIKEMKELCALLENASSELETNKKNTAPIQTIFTWAAPQERPLAEEVEKSKKCIGNT